MLTSIFIWWVEAYVIFLRFSLLRIGKSAFGIKTLLLGCQSFVFVFVFCFYRAVWGSEHYVPTFLWYSHRHLQKFNFFFPLLENLNETKDLTLKMLTFCGYIMANCTVLLIYGKLHNQATNPVWWFEEARNSTSTRRKIHVTLSGSVSLTLLAFYCSFTKSHTDLYMLQAYYPTI